MLGLRSKLAKKIMAMIWALVSTRLRVLFNLPLIDEDESCDNQLKEVTNFFLQLQDSPVEGTGIDYLEWLQSDPESIEDRRIFWQCYKFRHPKLFLSTDSSSLLVKKGEIEPLKYFSIFKYWYRYRKKIRAEHRKIEHQKTRRVEFRIELFAQFLPLLSLLALIAGYLHTKFFYSYFGIKAELYFSISDYLASSVEQIQHSFFGMAGFLIGTLIADADYTATNRYAFDRQVRSFSRLYFISLVFAVSLLIATYILKSISPATIFAIFVVAFYPVLRLVLFVSFKYFNNPKLVYSTLMGLILFFASLTYGTVGRIYALGEDRSETKYEFELEGKKYTSEEATLIGASSRYIFILFDKGTVGVVTLEKIERYTYRGKDQAAGSIWF